MRYKEFNANRVLEKCINLFWNKGFVASSIKDIVDETGVNRFSLYNEFENKEGILFQTLNLYHQRYINKKLVTKRADSAKNEILELFNNYLTDDEQHPPGCYIIHIATEIADQSEQVKTVLEEYLKELENKLTDIIEYYPETKSQTNFLAKHLVGLFCSTVCFSVIQTYPERIAMLNSAINVILDKKTTYATHT